MKKYLFIILAASLMLSCVEENMTVKETAARAPAVEYPAGKAVVKFNEMMTAQIEEALASGSVVTKSSRLMPCLPNMA